ncbi:MAG: protein-glutamate O-methyltransferase CheR [Polyangiaceae bacterium]
MSRVARPDRVERLRAVVARGLGLAFDETKSSFLEDVLARGAQHAGRDVEAYLARLEADPHRELRALAPDLTVGETYFFRNRDQFRALSEVVLPDRMRARAGERRLRVLSAGCASGEEAYSLAIFVREHVTDPSWDASILAVDVNPAALERAARATFTPWALRETTPDVERRWFRVDGRDLQLVDGARERVRFEEHNLVEDDPRLWSEETYDVVFCRNVLMYFTPESSVAVVERIRRSLVPGGYLFLGHAETLRGLSSDFHLCHTHGTFYYQRRDRDGVRADPPPFAPIAPAPDVDGTWIERIQRASARIEAITSSRPPDALPPPASPGERARPDLAPALALLAEERYADALERVGALTAGSAVDSDALLLRAVLLTHGGRLTEAEEACRSALAVDELDAGAHYALALCREGVGDLQGAVEEDQVALYLDGSFAMPRLHLGLLARKAGDRETARRELGQALVLLQREDPSRVLLFGGGFRREALRALCRAELEACGGHP